MNFMKQYFGNDNAKIIVVDIVAIATVVSGVSYLHLIIHGGIFVVSFLWLVSYAIITKHTKCIPAHKMSIPYAFSS